jgi:hypothetical protein
MARDRRRFIESIDAGPLDLSSSEGRIVFLPRRKVLVDELKCCGAQYALQGLHANTARGSPRVKIINSDKELQWKTIKYAKCFFRG